MRTFDKYHEYIEEVARALATKETLSANPKDREDAVNCLGLGVPLFDITGPARDLAKNNLDISTISLPRQRLPFPIMWAEFLLPMNRVVDGDEHHMKAKMRGSRCGAILRETRGGSSGYSGNSDLHVAMIVHRTISKLAAMKDRGLDVDPEDEVLAAKTMEDFINSGEISVENADKKVYNTVDVALYSDAGGHLSWMYMAQWMLDEGGFMIPQSFITEPEVVSSQQIDQHLAFMWAIGLLNCVNIEAEDTFDTRSSLGKKQRRKGYQGHVYKTLRIKSSNKRRRDTEGVSGVPSGLRGHLVRGHFKYYTEEAPLFGRYTGTYYWQPQYRGNQEVGEVHKDYQLTTEKENA